MRCWSPFPESLLRLPRRMNSYGADRARCTKSSRHRPPCACGPVLLSEALSYRIPGTRLRTLPLSISVFPRGLQGRCPISCTSQETGVQASRKHVQGATASEDCPPFHAPHPEGDDRDPNCTKWQPGTGRQRNPLCELGLLFLETRGTKELHPQSQVPPIPRMELWGRRSETQRAIFSFFWDGSMLPRPSLNSWVQAVLPRLLRSCATPRPATVILSWERAPTDPPCAMTSAFSAVPSSPLSGPGTAPSESP